VHFVRTSLGRYADAEAMAASLPSTASRARFFSALPLSGRTFDVANTKIGQITIDYRGETQQFNTASLAANFLRQDRIKMGWFHKIKASVDLMMDDRVSQTRHLKGDKFRIMKELEQLEDEIKQSNA
jgi:hypothetical protein